MDLPGALVEQLVEAKPPAASVPLFLYENLTVPHLPRLLTQKTDLKYTTLKSRN